jgi:hypothetical protein
VPEDEPGQFSKYVQESREALTRLLVKIENWRQRKPEITRVSERRWRAEDRLIHPPQHLDANKRAQRSRPAFEARQSVYTEVWKEFGALLAEVRITGEGLERVLGSNEAKRFVAEANASSMTNIDPMEQAARWAAERIVGFWQASQASEPTRPVELSSPPHGPRSLYVPQAAGRLQRHLDEKGTNRFQFAKRLAGKVSLKAISKLLNSKVATSSTLDEIAAAMRISKEELVRPE